MPDAQTFTDFSISHQGIPAEYPVGLLSQPQWYPFTRKNGYAKRARGLYLKIQRDPSVMETLWQQFSPNQSVFDLWEVRNAFLGGYGYQPLFVTLVEKGINFEETVGVLPLCIDPDTDPNTYRWYGTNWPEDNTFFVRDHELIPLLLVAAPNPLIIDCIKPNTDLDFLMDFPGFTRDSEKKYFLDLTKCPTVDAFLARLKKKRRYNLKRDRKRIQSLSPVVRINHPGDIEHMFALNIARFRQKHPDSPDDYSTFEKDRQKNAFRNLIKNAERYQTRLITTVIDGEVAAVEMGLVYNKTYYALNAGSAVWKYSGIGVYSNLLVIEDAIRLGCTTVDFLEQAQNWKHLWQLDSYYQYRFEK